MRGMGVGTNIITKGNPSRTSMQKSGSRVARKILGHIREIRDLLHGRLKDGRLEYSIGHG